MLDKYACLKKLAARRGTRDAVVTTMSVSMPWAEITDTPLDFASVPNSGVVTLPSSTAPTSRTASPWRSPSGGCSASTVTDRR